MINDINNLEGLIPEASPELREQFQSFFEMISHYNSKINLIAKSTISSAVNKHFADSFYGIEMFKMEIASNTPVFDFGSGNGFPGIVAAMMLPSQKFILVERDHRKAEFIKIASSKLSLTNIEVHAGSLTELKDESVQLAMSRAMAPLPRFLLETREVVKPGGSVFLYKGENWMREFGEIPAQVFDHWEVALFGQYKLPDKETERFIIRCDRISS